MKKVLIPNRGEIAVRIIRAAHQLGLQTVVTLSELEQDTLPARLSDEVHYFEEGPFDNNYLNIERIISLAFKYEADCIHPGYGFLSENYLLAEACQQAGITFIGPSADNLRQMGDKQVARSIAQKAGVALTQSWEGTIQTILAEADQLPYPVLVKAAMGGGGKGMKICYNKEELIESLPALSKQALRYFGDERLYVEQYISHARHIEVQVLADKIGNTVHLYDRECSVQRRFQKIIEEAPASNLSAVVKERLYQDAIHLCQSINYSNAGTIEFLVDEQGQHYFLEMNTRIQVEHCVTEEVTGIDLVQWQFKIAQGKALAFQQKDITIDGHAIELRLCAEDASNNFQPNPGTIHSMVLPDAPSCRLEIGFEHPCTIHPQFDPMIAKLVVHARDRNTAIQKALTANNAFIIHGIKTNGNFLNRILKHDAFKQLNLHTRFCDEHIEELLTEQPVNHEVLSLAYVSYRLERLKGQFWRQLMQFRYQIEQEKYTAEVISAGSKLQVKLNNQLYTIEQYKVEDHVIELLIKGHWHRVYCFEAHDTLQLVYEQQLTQIKVLDWLPPCTPKAQKEDERNGDHYLAPIPSQVMKVHVNEGQEVKKGDVLLVLEAMKTENHIKAWKDGVIEKIHIRAGQQVKLNQNLLAYKSIAPV
jgi:acetyl/propionyl-CoA carboxylase alpha subunit